jgi:hypothetical protein
MNAIRTLLNMSIDYAGLFPPAGLDMAIAVSNYAQYRAGPSAWALGRFVVPASRLSEFEFAAEPHLPRAPGALSWQLGVLAGPDLGSDLEQIGELNGRHAHPGAAGAKADTLEAKATSEAGVEEIMRRIPPGLQAYIEIPIDHDPSGLVAAIGRLGGRAKVRTGGVTKEAFPRTADLMRFVQECVRAGVPFKATAGLHHPLRGEYRLTYAPDSPRSIMFGFLNLLLATAVLRAGLDQTEAMGLLEEKSPEAFQVDEGGIGWRGRRLDLKTLEDARRDGMISFGSCSFTEPIADLEALHLLQPEAQRA